MNFLAIPAILTRGRAPKAALWTWLASCPLWVAAHGGIDHTAPAAEDSASLRLGAAAAITYLQADRVLPSARMDGFLLQGDEGIDRRGWGLEHGVLEAAWRWNPQWQAYVAIGKHGSDRAHTEAFWLQLRQPYGSGTWLLTAGRQRPAMGAVLESAGHFDRFALMPLAQQASVNGLWIDDGVQWGWRGALAQWPLALDVGLWKGAVFPGAAQGPVVPTLHIGTAVPMVQGTLALDGFATHLEPQGRGSRTSKVGGGHSHSAPICNNSTLGQVACFDGRTDLAATSARWQGHDVPLILTAAAWWRRDSGGLSSANGDAQYRGNSYGGWLEAHWQFRPRWDWGLRTEQLQARHSLHGPGAALLASETRLNRYQRAHRTSTTLGYQWAQGPELQLELGRESVAGQRQSYALLRGIWRLEKQVRP